MSFMSVHPVIAVEMCCNALLCSSKLELRRIFTPYRNALFRPPLVHRSFERSRPCRLCKGEHLILCQQCEGSGLLHPGGYHRKNVINLNKIIGMPLSWRRSCVHIMSSQPEGQRSSLTREVPLDSMRWYTAVLACWLQCQGRI